MAAAQSAYMSVEAAENIENETEEVKVFHVRAVKQMAQYEQCPWHLLLEAPRAEKFYLEY